MAANKPTEETTGDETALVEITLLKKQKNTTDSVFCGVCAAEGWRPGKSVSATDYDAAVQQFLKRSVGKAGR
jgi:hypothetical protein